jgi:hypothetical protein
MKRILKISTALVFTALTFFVNAQDSSLVIPIQDGRYQLSDSGASYFANLSLECVSRTDKHFYYRYYDTQRKGNPKDYWPSFHGCYDWHSSVHNHWCLVKILKEFPNIPEAAEIREKLNQSFNAENILKELEFVSSNEEGLFEFPYGQSWLLKLADELIRWPEDEDAQQWLINLQPLVDYIAEVHIEVWPQIEEVDLSGSHDSPAMGLSFAYDYAVNSKNKKLKKVVANAALKYYEEIPSISLEKEPYVESYDFMSAGLLVADLMRKVMPEKKYIVWLKGVSPNLFIAEKVKQPLKVKKVKKHDGFEAHFDGFHLNRIWCLNGILKTLPENTLSPKIKTEWVSAMNEMWDYAQESIGKGNYDIDHWLSSFSVFALMGYED